VLFEFIFAFRTAISIAFNFCPGQHARLLAPLKQKAEVTEFE
jgi:hypothetical protein